IAREKAGIVKTGVPLVLGDDMDPEAQRAINEVAANVGAPITIASGSAMLSGTNLRGAHQHQNANVAIAIAFELGLHISSPENPLTNPQTALRNALQHVTWPGRLERIETGRGPVLLDAAHNPDGAAALAGYLGDSRENDVDFGKPITLLFGTLADKAWPAMIDLLAPLATHRVYTTPKGRAPTDLAAIAARFPGKMAADPIEALALAREIAGPNGLVVVCGSIFLIGEIRAHLLGLPLDPAVAL
ncbi:MAG: cyanophycin synthetase, partial [Polyangiaceae bacterium]